MMIYNFLIAIFLSLFLVVSMQREGDLRLASGSNYGGRLEIYINQAWSRICYDNFDIYKGDIACKQLYFLYAQRVGTTRSLGYGTGSGKKVLIGLSCSTSNKRLIDCTTSSTSRSCSYSYSVALVCTNKTSTLRLVSDSGRTSNLSSGRLEILINNQWGTICSHFFSKVEADVACRQMGYESANNFTKTSYVGYKTVSKPIWLDHLDCSSSTSTKNDLRLCALIGTGITSCSHSSDIFLSCTSPGFIRLTSSTSSYKTNGQLEMYWNGTWGAICGYPSFSRNAAQVACRQLGFDNVVNYGLTKLSRYSYVKSTHFVLSGIQCSSSYQRTLLNCSHGTVGYPSSYCTSSKAVYLSCAADTTSSTTKNSYPGSTAAGGSAGVSFIILIFYVVGGIYLCWKCGCCSSSSTSSSSFSRSYTPTRTTSRNMRSYSPPVKSYTPTHTTPVPSHNSCVTPATTKTSYISATHTDVQRFKCDGAEAAIFKQTRISATNNIITEEQVHVVGFAYNQTQ